MASRRVYLHNAAADAPEQYRQALADQGLGLADCPSADAIVLFVDTDIPMAEGMSLLLHRVEADSVPVIAVGGDVSSEAYASAAAAGLQAYIPTTEPQAVAATVRMVFDAACEYTAINPLTGLPGSPALEQEILRRIDDRGGLAVIALDLDNFKPYNDVYGYRKGDRMILHLKQLIEEAVAECGPQHSFIAHIGGDDFFLTADVASARILGERIVKAWEASNAQLFDDSHVRAGEFSALNRRGEEEKYELTTLSAVMVTNEASDITHPGHIATVLAQLKAHVKTMEGSNFFVDRRQDHWGKCTK
jgi:diguanylate cyclase (GGDEF)-like protein